MLNKQLQNMSHGIEHLQLATESKVPYLIAYKPHTNEFYIAFRGTESLQTFLPSLLCVGVPNDFQGRVHAGYAQDARLIPLTPFTRLLNPDSTCKLIFTGHSLGGAIAAMVTCNILFDEQSIRQHERISCIAFGAPFFADEECAAYLNNRFQDRFHFYINHSDPIPFAFCFLHDCFQKLSSSEQMQACINWLKKLLGAEQAAFTSDDQSLMHSFISNAPATQLFEATEMFKTATRILYPIFSTIKVAVSKYQLFGECYHIVTEWLTNSVPSSAMTTTNQPINNPPASRIVVKPMQSVEFHLKWLKMTPESIIRDLISCYQDHGIQNYIAELHTHVIVKSGLGLHIESPAAQLMSKLMPGFQAFSSTHFLPTDDPSHWLYDTDFKDDAPDIGQHYWSAVSTDYPKDELSNISFQFRGPTVCFFLTLQYCEQKGISDPLQLSWKDAIRRPTCDEFSLSFEIEKVRTCAKRDMLYRCVHHFGTMDLSKIIDSSKFTSSTSLTGREQQVANFKLVELYLAALSYVLFTQPSTQETASAQATTVSNKSDQRRREIVQRELLLCEQLILKDRQMIEKNLLATNTNETHLFRTEVEKIRADGARFAELNKPDENDSNSIAITGTSDFHLHTLSSLFDLLLSKPNPLVIITKAIPTLVAMGLIITDKLLIHSVARPSLMAAGSGLGAGGIAMYVIRLLGGSLMLAFAVGMILLAAIGYGVYKNLLTVIDQEYFKMLEFIAKSMGVHMQKTRQHPYWLERAISEIYETTMAEFSDTYICEKWKTSFFQHHDLANISDKQMRLNWLSRVKCVHAHFTLRQEMSGMLTVGVIGIGKVGKSMLIHKMFCFDTQSGARRTTQIKPYSVSDHFQMLDIPHVTSAYDTLKRSFAHSYTMMNGIIVVLDAQQQGDDSKGEGYALRIVQQLSMEGVDVLYCFNKSDVLVRDFDEGNKSASSTLSDDEDDGINNLSPAKERTQNLHQSVIWSKETTKTKISEFADRYKQYGVQRDQCKLTFFELNERNKNERNIIKNRLKSLGILDGADIRNIWLRRFLSDNGFNKQSIDQVMQFRFPPIVRK